MQPKFYRAWLAASVFSYATFGLIASAAAQSSPTQGLSTINVVARKHVENLQKVPLTITAIPAKTLKEAHVENIHDIAALTPGVDVSDIGAEVGTSITIRGITDLTFGVGVPDVATFLDGAYLRDPAAINVAAIPLSDVEITKSPSSALYGRDAYSGVITYLAQRPTTTPHADISETAGDYGKSELVGDISGPIIGDKVLGEVFGDFDTFNGTYKDKISGARGGSYQKKDFGALLDVNWASNISTHIDYYYGDDYFGNTAVEAPTPNCGPFPTPEVVNGQAYLLPENSLYCGRIKTNGTVQIAPDTANSDEPGNVRRTFFITGNTTAVFDWGTLQALTAASQIDERAYQSFDPSSTGVLFPLVPAGPGLGTVPTNTAGPGVPYVYSADFYGAASQTANFSQEFRFTSPQNQPIRYGAGASLYSETRFQESSATFADGVVPAGYQVYSPFDSTVAPYGINNTATWGTSNGQPGQDYNKSIETTDEESGFAEAAADLLPNLTISSEYRYTWSLQQFSIIKNQYSTVDYPYAYGDDIHAAHQYFMSNEAIDWTFLPKQMAYFAFANGVKPGGFNGASTVPADDSFGPETDLNFEGGIKSSLLDNHLQLDGAIYHIDTSNVQVYSPSSDPTNPATVIKNFGQTSNTGFELDARALVADGLTLTGGFNYNNPTFNAGTKDYADTSYCALIPSCKPGLKSLANGLTYIPIAGNSLPYTSNYTLSADLEYDWAVMDQFPAYVRGDMSYKSSEYTDPAELTSIGASTTVDAFAGISRGRYTLEAYVKNITNDETPTEAPYNVQLSNFQNVPTVDLPEGRTFAFTVAAKF
jgi:outer membrane receptor protein involved in Fe transport